MTGTNVDRKHATLHSKSAAFRWLRELLVIVGSHLLPNLDQDSFNAVIPTPMREDGHLRRFYRAIDLINKREIYARDELDSRRLIRVTVSAMNLKTVYAILVYSMSGPDYGTIPVAHHDIVAVLQTV